MNIVRHLATAAVLLWLQGCGQPTAGGSSSTGNALGARIVHDDGTTNSGDSAILRTESTDSVSPIFAVALSDAHGQVRFDRVPDGLWTLEARGAVEGRLVRLRISKDSSGAILRTGPYSTISGISRIAGSTSDGLAMLAGTSQSARIDSNGTFTFLRVSPGIHRIVARPRADGTLGSSIWTESDILPGVDDTLPASQPIKARSSDWIPRWTETFGTLDSSRWSIDTGNGCPSLCGWGKGALQTFKTENVILRDGALVLRADSGSAGWKSGQVQTRGKLQFRYGRLEIDAILPDARGAWSLISLQGDSSQRVWPEAGAIDIAGLRGHQPDSLMGIAHRTDTAGVGAHLGTNFGSTLAWTGRKATYAIEWSPSEIVWLADDQVFYRVAGGPPFDHTFYLSIGLTVGGDGNVAPDTNAPFELVVQQVRLFARAP